MLATAISFATFFTILSLASPTVLSTSLFMCSTIVFGRFVSSLIFPSSEMSFPIKFITDCSMFSSICVFFITKLLTGLYKIATTTIAIANDNIFIAHFAKPFL